MSTNFYIYNDINGAEEHIGKRCARWRFSFHGRNFKTVGGWMTRLSAMGAQESIVDEYGRTYTFAQFVTEVNNSTDKLMGAPVLKEQYVDCDFLFSPYEFS